MLSMTDTEIKRKERVSAIIVKYLEKHVEKEIKTQPICSFRTQKYFDKAISVANKFEYDVYLIFDFCVNNKVDKLFEKFIIKTEEFKDQFDLDNQGSRPLLRSIFIAD